MKNRKGFTLIELLVVISIIGILAGILLPALTRAKTVAKVTQAKTEIQGLKGAIEQYYATYQRYPTSKSVRKDGVSNFNPDFTFGTWGTSGAGSPSYAPKGAKMPTIIPTTLGKVSTNNSEIVAILMDQDRTILNQPKKGNPENPQGQIMLNAKGVNNNTSPGVSNLDGVYRDPWGSPYIITVDLNYDNACRDGFYRGDKVAQDSKVPTRGLSGFVKADKDSWELRTGVMVWSLGPDKAADPNNALNAGVNKDNITSW